MPILPKWKKLKGAKKHALKSALKPVSEDLPEDDSKSAQKRNRKEQPDAREAKPSKPAMAEAPKPATDRKESAAGKRQVAAKRPAEFAGVSGTKRKKVEGGIEEVKALPAAPESSKEPSAQAEGTGTGTRAEPDSAASGRRKRGQDVEKGANAIAGKGAEERDAKRARGPGGRVVSSRFRETPSRETTSGEAEKPQKQAQKGGVQKAASVPPQEAPGGRRRSSMVPIASLIRTRNRRGGEEKVEEGAEGMDIAFSQVPIASLREKKEVVGKGKLGAGTGPRGKKADVGGGKVGKKGTVAQAKGRAGSKRKAETLEEKSGLENAEVEEDIGMKKGVEVAAGAQDGETVPVATEMDATTEAAAGGKKSGGKTTEWAAGEENAKEGGTVNQSGVGEKKPVRKGRKTKGDVEVTETRRLDVDRGAEVPSEAGTGNGAGTGTVILTRTGTGTGIGTVKGQGASANVGAAEGGEIIVEDEPAAESKGKRTVGKRGRAAGKQGKAAQTHAKVEKEEKETGVPTANGEGERPTKRTRRGQLVTEGAEKKGVDPEVKAEPSKRVSSRGVRKTANEAKEKGPSRKRAPIEEVDEPENAEEAAGTSRSGRTSGENVGNQGGRGRLSVRVSGRVSDDLEGLVSPTLRKKREMGEVRVFVSSRMPDRMKAAQKKVRPRIKTALDAHF